MKNKTIFFCNECGYETSKWMGKCPGCGVWHSFVEEKVTKEESRVSFTGQKAAPSKLAEIKMDQEQRIDTGIPEFDRVLGGGIVKGSLVLVGGDPGIGKSTLLLQMCRTVKSSGNILYASAEESQRQIKMRADRLGMNSDNLYLLAENDMDKISDCVKEIKPEIIIIDSVQTVYSPALTSAPGSISQVREVTMTLMRIAKENGISIFLVGHVTKDGSLAGPRVLEHMVDCVLYFEGERRQFHRILRGVKNRFGSTNEIGVFEMSDKGLVEVENPSAMLISERPENASGSCVVCTMEGTRPMLAEIQALVSYTNFPTPKRSSTGIDYNRISMLMAVLEKRLGFKMSTQDAYVNVIGGISIDEPAADLGVVIALVSSFKNFCVPSKLAAVGEIGLTGEIRSVNSIDRRIAEASKMGFDYIIIPKGSSVSVKLPDNVTIKTAANVKDVLNILI